MVSMENAMEEINLIKQHSQQKIFYIESDKNKNKYIYIQVELQRMKEFSFRILEKLKQFENK